MAHVRIPGAWSRAILLALLLLVLGPVARAGAQAPTVAIAMPSNNAVTNNPTPSFSGSTDDPLDEVTLSIYSGATAEGTPVQSLTVVPLLEEWSAGPAADLPDGTYTAVATQTNLLLEAGASAPVTFTVDTVAPVVSLAPSAPISNDSTPSFSGQAGIATGDSATVKLQIYAGGAPVAGSPIDTVEVACDGETWAVDPVPSLADGTYTALAEQLDEAGNLGVSQSSTFTIDTVAPEVSLTAVPTPTSNATPDLGGDAGVATGDGGLVRLRVYAGSTASGDLVDSLEVSATAGKWATGPLTSLADGTYTAQAEQSDAAGNAGLSGPSTFTIDTTPPTIAMTSPAKGTVTVGPSQLVDGTAGTDVGDSPSVTIKLFVGSSTGVPPRETVIVQAVGGHWSTTLGGLSQGTYTVSSEQSDEAGNTGESGPVTFTVRPPEPVKETEPITVKKDPTTKSPGPESPAAGSPTATASTQTPAPTGESAPHSPPVASFTWFPTAPRTGQTVSLVSSSTDLSSPIATIAWGIADSPLQLGGTVFTTSFGTAGTHIVRMRVVAADGLASTVTEGIPVSLPPVSLMQPFPIVRIAGTDTARGAKLTLLTVAAPAGARVTVVCHGHGCPVKPMSRLAASSNGGVVLLEFHRFERALQAGAVLEIRVSEHGEIGKYTRFRIRRGKLPERTDRCLSATGIQSMSCPPS